MIKSKLKELWSEKNKKKNDCKIFYSSPEYIQVTASDSDIDKAFISMHESIITKIKNYACKGWIVFYVIIKHSIKIFEC